VGTQLADELGMDALPQMASFRIGVHAWKRRRILHKVWLPTKLGTNITVLIWILARMAESANYHIPLPLPVLMVAD
jgi:hypothetical protein